MRNLLKADFYKIVRSLTFWICLAVGLVMAVLMVVGLHAAMNRALESGRPDREAAAMAAMAQAASGTWSLTQFLPTNFDLILAAVFVAVFVTSEFSYGTVKNMLSRGAKRWQVFTSKLVVCALASVAILFAFSATLVIAGSIAWGLDPQGVVSAGAFVQLIATQTLLAIVFAALFVFFAMTIRSGGGAIATNIVAVMMASYLFSALNLLVGSKIDLTQYWLTTVISNLATYTPAGADITRGLIVAVVWGVAAVAGGIVVFNKRDVK